MKPREKKPETVFRIINRETGEEDTIIWPPDFEGELRINLSIGDSKDCLP